MVYWEVYWAHLSYWGLLSTLELNTIQQAKEVADLQQENISLQKQIAVHVHKLEELESYSKGDNLIVRG